MKQFTTDIEPDTPSDCAADVYLSTRKGLYGGAMAERRAKGGTQLPPSPYVLDPYGEGKAEEDFGAFVSSGLPLEVEIGFGPGVFLETYSRKQQDRHILGFEVRTKMCQSMVERLQEQELKHVRIVQADARAVFAAFMPDNHLSAVHINFPDPWWKKRHHKRRVFSPSFVDLIHQKLQPGGRVFARTDVLDYAQLIDMIFESNGQFESVEMEALPLTYREKQCEIFGLPVHRRCFRKLNTP